MSNQITAARIVAYMRSQGYQVFTDPGHLNIVYFEGMDTTFKINRDLLDGWNDLRTVIRFTAEGIPQFVHIAVATTEPGASATKSKQAKQLGGVARIAFGQHFAWRMGWHQQKTRGKKHPALVQCAPIRVHRDFNMDGFRTGDPLGWADGLNQHGTSLTFRGKNVGTFSLGCLVGYDYAVHCNQFMPLCGTDTRYLQDANYVFGSTIIAADRFLLAV